MINEEEGHDCRFQQLTIFTKIHYQAQKNDEAKFIYDFNG